MLGGQVLVSVLPPREICHNHCLGRVSWLRRRLNILLLLLDGRIPVQLVVFGHVAVSATYHSPDWGRGSVGHTKRVGALRVQRHLDLERWLPVVERMHNFLLRDCHH